jgi:pantoate--beta-alanine ligase
MKIVRTITGMQQTALALKRKGKTIGFVPTMGALHAGHLSLIRQSVRQNDLTVVSIFVNPIQFGPHEDLKRYPRTLASDVRLCKEAGVAFVFYPTIAQMYPRGFATRVEVKGLSDRLCGAVRQGHFCGVATVVTKLFNIVQPDSAYFGSKDAQQAIILQQLAHDLNMPVKIHVMATVREKDGLAMSSRNAYLSPQERRDSVVLSKALGLAREMICHGQKNTCAIIRRMKALIQAKKSAKIEYLAIVDRAELKPVNTVKNDCLIAVAVRIGKTRLIDNLETGDGSHFLTRSRLRKK